MALSLFRSGVIYTLNCPDTNMVMYVGKSFSVQHRKNEHFNAHKKDGTRKALWVRQLKSEGKLPVFDVIDNCDEFNWEQKEKNYIKMFKSCGANLLNMTQGGECGSLGVSRTQESKINISKKLSKVNKTESHNLNVSKALKYRFKNDAEFAKMFYDVNIKKIQSLTKEQKNKAIESRKQTYSRTIPERIELANTIMNEINKGGRTRVEIAASHNMSYEMLKNLLIKYYK